MYTFITILAFTFIILTTVRIIGIYYGLKEHIQLIMLAEAAGGTPVQDALLWPVITWIICASWLTSLLF